MKLETKNKTIELVLTTRKIVDIAKILKGNNFEEVYMKVVQAKDLDSLTKIIYTLSVDKAFTSSEEVYDFLDDYKKENNKSYEDIFKEIAEVVNEEGFFNKKMKEEELEQTLSNPLLNMDMNDLVKRSAEKAISKVAEEEFRAKEADQTFKGYKA